MGCEVVQTASGTIEITQNARLESIDEDSFINNLQLMPRKPDRAANNDELRRYRSVIGQMLYIGRM